MYKNNLDNTYGVTNLHQYIRLINWIYFRNPPKGPEPRIVKDPSFFDCFKFWR